MVGIGDERKIVEFEPLETEVPAPIEPAAPVTPAKAPVEAPAEEPVGV
jgi:hypothetical protein